MTEKAWQQVVLELATLYRWRNYHTYDSRRSNAGFPDLVLVRPPELIYAELKTDRGRISAAQRDWLLDLEDCGCEVWLWRPQDLDVVHERLKRRSAPAARRPA